MYFKNNTSKKEYLYRIFGGVLILIFLVLTFVEYQRIFYPTSNFEPKARYIDYSILLYVSRWIIYFLLFLAGVFTFFKSKKAYLFLWAFSLTTLLELYFNEAFYIIHSIGGYPKYILLGISVASLIVVSIQVFKNKEINFTGIFLSIILAMVIVYLPNALITFYF